MTRLGFGLGPAEVSELIRMLDADHDGTVSSAAPHCLGRVWTDINGQGGVRLSGAARKGGALEKKDNVLDTRKWARFSLRSHR